ncbi:MAG: insulinase family protein, partial [Chitinophagaceae bacterium]
SYALDILGELLSGSKTSPLYQVIVAQKKLAPSAFARNQSKELAGEFYLRVRGNADTKLDDVKKALEEALTKFEKEGFTDKELVRIKAGQETSLYTGIESILSKAQRLGRDNEYAGDPGFITKEAQLVQAVTREDIMRVYNKYIKGKNYIATSFVPKGKKDLAVSDAQLATVWIEPVVQGVANEDVAPGEEAKFEKTKTKHDRSEPPFGEMPLFKMPAIWQGSLANGIKVYGIQSNETPLVSFEVVMKGGHWADPIQKSGVSVLLANLLMQGTATKTPAELEEAIDLLGASINVSSSNEEMRIRATCLERNFEPTLALVEEILLKPRWDKAEYDRLYKALQTSIQGREANAQQLAAINFNKLIYGDKHIFGYPSDGTKETVAAITLDDLKNYYNQYISPSVAVVHVAGAVPQARVTKSLANLEKNWKAKPVSLPTYSLPEQNNSGTVYFIDVPDAKQSVLYVGKLGVSASDPASAEISYANEVLGGGISGRLGQTLRIAKGYTYGAQSFQSNAAERAPFMAVTSVRANATLPSLQLIQEMIKQYGPTFTDAEVALTKNKVLKGSTLTYESLSAKLSMLNSISKYNRSLRFIEEDQQKLVGMKLDDYQRIINKHFKEDDMIYLVVGDKATQLGEVKKLGKTKVVQLDIHGNPVGI